MRLPLLSGIVADETAEFIQTYPVNLEPVAVDNKIARGQLRMTSGAVKLGTGPGTDKAALLWEDDLYRVMGTSLIRISPSAAVTTIGDVGGGGYVSMDAGFDRMSVGSGGKLFYYDGSGLAEVTDPDLGQVVDHIWIDGYFMTTDGVSVVVTELSNPLSVKPLKYGSAEEDPDGITGLLKYRNEAHVLGRHTIQVFRNVGGNGFPFDAVQSATIPVGCVGPGAKCLFADGFAFVGSARNEALGVYLAGNGAAEKISPRAIDDEIAKLADPAAIRLENRSSRGERRLLVHLPDKTLVFLLNASKATEESVWYIAQSGTGAYRLRNAVYAYGQYMVGDLTSGAFGALSDAVATHFGEAVEWRFDAGLIYNQARGGVVRSLELIGLPGRTPGAEGAVAMSMTQDGETWTSDRWLSLGERGERAKRVQWRPSYRFRNWIGFRFRGQGEATPGFAALEAEVIPLAV